MILGIGFGAGFRVCGLGMGFRVEEFVLTFPSVGWLLWGLLVCDILGFRAELKPLKCPSPVAACLRLT